MDWDQLEASSANLVDRDEVGMPRIDRNIDQVQQMSEMMVARIRHRDSTADGFASARLLAQQGLNQRQLAKALNKFEMKATYEDVYQTQHPNVQEYLKHVQQATLLSAIHEAQKDAVSAFDDFMDQVLETDWAKDRAKLVNTIMPIGSAANRQQPSKPAASPAATSNRALMLPAANGAPSPSQSSGSKPELDEQTKKYAEVVRSVNKALVGGSSQQLDVTKAFLAACPEVANAERRMTMHKVWSLADAMCSQVRSQLSDSDISTALNVGSREFLEKSYREYMQSELRRHRNQGALSSSSTLLQLQAFARVRGPEGRQDKDLDWEVLYLALRCGYYQEAIKDSCSLLRMLTLVPDADIGLIQEYGDKMVAKDIRDPTSSMIGHTPFDQLLTRWAESKQSLPPQQRAQVAAECSHQLSDRSSTGSRALQHKYRVAAHVILAADPGLADQVTREQAIISTIEDFMWLKLHMVQPTAPSSSPNPRLSPNSSSNLLTPAYSLTNLQDEVVRWGPDFFSQNGAQPLVYVVVLLLSQHFRRAAEWMHTRSELQQHAVHIAIALNHCQLLGGDEEQSMVLNTNMQGMIQEYGQNLTSHDPHLALEYYWQSAAVVGGSLTVKEELLQRVITDSRAYGTLLGSGAIGDSGALSSFVPDSRERRGLMEAVGETCEQQGQFEQARELYLAAPNPCAALRIMNRQLSDLIPSALTDTSAQEDVKGLRMRAANTIEKIQQNQDQYTSAGREECETFERLCIIQHILTAAQGSDYNTVLQQLTKLPFIPDKLEDVPRCTAYANKRLHVAIKPRLNSVISAAFKAYIAGNLTLKLKALAAYGTAVDSVDQNIVSDINRQVSRLTY